MRVNHNSICKLSGRRTGGRGVPHLRSGGVPHVQGVPNLRSRGYPISGGYPMSRGHPLSGRRHPMSGGYPMSDGGYPISVPPIAQSSIASTCYTVGGVPLAFRQEDLLYYDREYRATMEEEILHNPSSGIT